MTVVITVEKEDSMNRLYIVMYHYTRDLVHSRYPEIKGLDVNLFRQQIQFFKEKFHIVTMESILEKLSGGGKAHCQRMLFCLHLMMAI